MRYAYFPQNRRLAIERQGALTIYDTAEFQFRGLLQAHSAEAVGISILTQRGRIRLADLVTVSAPPSTASIQNVQPQPSPPLPG